MMLFKLLSGLLQPLILRRFDNRIGQLLRYFFDVHTTISFVLHFEPDADDIAVLNNIFLPSSLSIPFSLAFCMLPAVMKSS